MSIRNRIATLILLVFVILFASAWLALRLAVLPAFVDVEQARLQREVARALQHVETELLQLHRVVLDWGSWDDSYAFVTAPVDEGDGTFVGANLVDNTFSSLHLDLMHFYADDGRVVWSRSLARDPVAERGSAARHIDAAVARWLVPRAQSEPARGLIAVADHVLMLAAVPITNSDGQLPPRGTLVMGRLLDNAQLRSWGEQAGIELVLHRPTRGAQGRGGQAGETVAHERDSGLQLFTEKRSLRAIKRIASLESGAVLQLELRMPRDIYGLGREAIGYTLGLLALLCGLLMAAMLISLQLAVVRPIGHLLEALAQTRQRHASGLRQHLSRSDELARLAVAFDTVLSESEADRSVLQREVLERRRIEDTLRLAAEVSSADGWRFLGELVATLVKALPVDYAFVGRLQGGERSRVQVVAASGGDEQVKNLVYDVAGGPCEVVLKRGECLIARRLREHFPDNELHRRLELNSYAGLLLRDAEGEPLGVLVVLGRGQLPDSDRVMDSLRVFAARAATVLERWQQDSRLRKLSRAVEQSPSMVVITDTEGLIEYVNPRFCEATGYAAAEVQGKSWTLFRPVGSEEPGAPTRGRRGEYRYRRKNGEHFWASESVSAIVDGDENISHYVMLQEDVTEQRRLADRVAWQATHDALTGLLNRSEFERRLGELISDGEPRVHALCYLDLDQFKVINDTCGHIAGDELLRQLAALLEVEVGGEPHAVARLGGDEFGICLVDYRESCARELAERLRAAIEEFEFYWGDQRFRIGSCIGVVMIERGALTLTELLKRADAACFAAKDAGRNRVHLYRDDDRELARQQGEMQWVSRIDRAIDENRLCIYLQPIVPTSGDDTGQRYECLLRLRDEDGRVVPPGAFLPAAERYGLATQLDRWVLHAVLDWLEALCEIGAPLPQCAINLSGHSLNDGGFLHEIIDRLSVSKLPANHLCFEVTETATIANLAHATVFMRALRSCGCRFALDDFGSGLSSFGYLKQLPVDYLKIDGVFVRDILDDPIDEAMVRSINQIGHVLNKRTIAEFVENEQVLALLRDIGVDFVQGFGVARPMPLEEYIPVLPTGADDRAHLA